MGTELPQRVATGAELPQREATALSIKGQLVQNTEPCSLFDPLCIRDFNRNKIQI